jgi:hypothetical protein
MAKIREVVLILILPSTLLLAQGQAPRFFPDDPIQLMPPPLPVVKPLKRDIDQLYDFLLQSNRPDPQPPVPAGAINTLGDVPDSEWFTNRHGRRRMTREELQRGPGIEEPRLPFTVTSGKNEGIMPGLQVEDSDGRRYILKVDSANYPELGSASDVIVSKFLWAIGYNTPKNEILYLNLPDLTLSSTAKITLPNGHVRDMTENDVRDIIGQGAQSNDGPFRVMASRILDGKAIGPFRFEGTRLDDPNDIVPHENRRDLRGLYVFAAWLNHTDAKANNTLDTIVEVNGVPFIRHHLIDFGSALGSDGDVPKDPRLGHEFMLPRGREAAESIAKLGVAPAPFERTPYPRLLGVGNFEWHSFDPDSWKSDYPNPAFLSRLPDDDFWAAKQVMAFTDEDIRAIVETARFSDPRSTEYVAVTLEERRDKIGRVFFSKVLPLDNFRVENNNLIFDDLAVKYGFRSPEIYQVRWFRFDNDSRKTEPISEHASTHLPDALRNSAPGSYFSATIGSARKQQSITIYIRKEENAYKVVGIDRSW